MRPQQLERFCSVTRFLEGTSLGSEILPVLFSYWPRDSFQESQARSGAGSGEDRALTPPVGRPSASLWALLGRGWKARRPGHPVTTFPITPGLRSPAVPTFQDRAFSDRRKWLQGCWGPGSLAPPPHPLGVQRSPGSQRRAEGHLSGNPPVLSRKRKNKHESPKLPKSQVKGHRKSVFVSWRNHSLI